MSHIRTLPIVAGLATISLMGVGCNPFQSATDQIVQKMGQTAAETAVNQASGGKVSLDASKGQVVVKDSQTGDLMAFGENVKLPDGFPADAPIYTGAKIVSVTISKQVDKGDSLTLKSDDAVSKVASWYTDHLKSAGFTEDVSTSAGGTEIRSYKKNTIKIALTISTQGDANKGSLVTLIRTETP